ncbi:ATP-binding protein [Streptomyces sp. SID3343]|uniref:NACHT domain-containing protein n=1 Tax=Streptomyces sp. SID3343 TaxID=2690260 RepID=UPI001368F7F0|nr:ATP-binding protein [Streptomyces sp. SID3343]MYV97261.1 hypothetical protein [Streptomyces sp. SID3343]
MGNFTKTVERFCRIQDEDNVLTEHGFLIDRWFGFDQLPTGLLPLEPVFEQSGVLLGEPGAGKTRALKVRAESKGAPDERPLYVDLGQIREESAFRRKTRPFHLDPETGTLRAPEFSSLFLDSLDECPAGLKVMCGWFEEYLSGVRGTAGRVFIGCRSAAYPGLIADTVVGVFGPLKRYTLSPLREVDVCALAASREIDGPAFLAEVRRVGAGPLAASPLTLDLLLRIYATRAHRLPTRRADVYADALPHLAIAQGEVRVRVAHRESRGRRMMVAARVCTHMLLTHSAGVVLDDTADEQDGDLRADDLTGGVPEIEGDGEFEVGSRLLHSVLDSALFSGRGDGRLRPVHNSYAAYLTAWYLTERKMSVKQLLPLLVQRGELGTPGIHPALRETAAWLIALDPEQAGWLLEADPEALLPYSDLIESSAHRSVLARTALARERDGVLQVWPRFRALWPLAHVGLADDLGPALEKLLEPSFDPAPDNPDFRVGKLALSLAFQVAGDELLPTVVALAAASHLPAATRAKAMRLAHAWAPDAMAVEFRSRLAEVVSGTVDDPLDELRGLLLDILWPDHLTIDELLQALAPAKNSRAPYAYYDFRAGLARRLREEDLGRVAAWGAADGHTSTGEQSHGLRVQDREVLQRLVDRSLTGPGVATRIPDIARWILTLLRDDDIELAVPAPLCVPPGSPAAGKARELRRALVTELVGLCEQVGDGGHVAYGWSWPRHAEPLGAAVEDLPRDFENRRSLVDQDDLMWLIEMEAQWDPATAATLHPLIGAAWNHEDIETWELVWPLQGTRVWNAVFGPYFEPTPIDDGTFAARRARRERQRQKTWPQYEDFVRSLNENLTAAANGDPACFPRLIEKLRTDPNTGASYIGLGDDLRNHPGIAHLRQPWPDLLEQAAIAYLTQTSPGTDGRIGTTVRSECAVSGYLALAYLERRPDGLDSLSADVWHTWAPVITAVDVTDDGGSADCKRHLLVRTREFAREQLEDTLLTLATSDDPQDARQTRFLSCVWSERIEAAILALLPTLIERVTVTPPTTPDDATVARTWLETTRAVLEQIVALGNHETRSWVLRLLDAPSTPLRHSALRTAVILSSLYADPANTWLVVSQMLQKNPSDLDAFVRAAAGRRDLALETRLHDTALVELATLLVRRHPPSTDPPLLIDGFTAGDDQVQTWRDRVLTYLSERRTAHTVRTLDAMSRSMPGERVLRSHAVAAENTHRAQVWSSPSTQELAALFSNPGRRVVRSGADLVTLVVDTLADIQQDLTTGFAQSFTLWNEYPATKTEPGPGRPKLRFRPKHENDLSDYLLHGLELRLAGSRVVVDREVQINRKRDGTGNRADLIVRALPLHTGPGRTTMPPVSVVIEVKGNWHEALFTAMHDQLVNDYLPHHGTPHGIYLVGDFPLKGWDDSDRNLNRARANRPATMKARLDQQAAELNATHGVDVTPIVLDISFIERSSRNER